MPDEPAVKERILAKALENAVFDGWNNAMLENSCADFGMAGKKAYVYFPRGVHDLVDFFEERQRARLEKTAGGKISEKISSLVMEYFELLGQHKPAVKKLSSSYLMPQNMAQGAMNLAKLADKIWLLAGDESADFSYYTKRLSLGAIISQTFLFWLGDESADFMETRSFFARRVGNLMTFHQVKNRLAGLFGKVF
jgi:ubiquinone biosynthesis protein COQ9